MNYQIELNEQQQKKHQATSLRMITGFAFVGIGAFTFLMGNADWVKAVFHKTIVSGAFLSIGSLVYGLAVLYLTFFKAKWSNQRAYLKMVHAMVAILFALVFFLSHWWLAASINMIVALANFFAYFYEQKLAQPLFVTINEEIILLPATSRRKQLRWTEVERLMLRHGIITIDCTDNYLFQWNVKNSTADVEAFEAFCRAKIEANRSKRQNEEW